MKAVTLGCLEDRLSSDLHKRNNRSLLPTGSEPERGARRKGIEAIQKVSHRPPLRLRNGTTTNQADRLSHVIPEHNLVQPIRRDWNRIVLYT